MKSIHLVLFMLFKMVAYTNAQYINNASFEGTPKANIPPPNWFPCAQFSTPDTGPGYWNCNTPASNGNSYLMMITRGPLGPYANAWEDCQTQLNGSLQKGRSYKYTIDLAWSNSWGHDTWSYGWISYATPVLLRIWSANTSCSRDELLTTIGPIAHTDWQTYTFTLAPTINDCKYLVLEAYYDHTPEYFGNILLDNIKYLEPDPDPNSNANANTEIIIPNVFTPNGDGKNDEFKIQGLTTDCSLKIYNRWGNVIYESSTYQNNWIAENVSDGLYYYILNSNNNKFWKGVVEIIR